MIDKILVALDYSPNNKYVFYSAVVLARSTGASIMLLHVLTEELHSGLPNYLNRSAQVEDYQQPGLNFLQQKATEAKTLGVNTKFVQSVGNPRQVICELAQEWSANLILVGGRSAQGSKETLLGSVGSYVTHHAPCSVLIVRPGDSLSDRSTMVDDSNQELTLERYLLFSNRRDLLMLNKILVAIDGGDRAVFDSATSLAQTTGASILLLHILSEENSNYPLLPTSAHYSILQDGEDIYQEEFAKYERQGIDFLQKLTQEAVSAGINAEYSQLWGNPQQMVCKLANNWSADLIVVGSRGLQSLKEMFLGSVSNYVTHHAPCSVLIVRPGEVNSDRQPSAAIELIDN